MIRKLLLILFGVFLWQSNFAQSKKLPESKHNPRGQYSILREYLEEHKFEYSFGYSQAKLLNPTFGEGVENSNIKPLYGYYFNFRYNVALPLIFEFGYSNSIFETKSTDYFDFLADEKINFKGFEANANFILMPAAKFFMPYIGLGYGFYSASTGYVFDKNISRYYSEKAYSPFFKAGATINFHEVFYVNAEYKHSLNVDNPFDFSQINAGMGFRIKGENFFRGDAKDDFDESGVILTYGYHQTDFLNTTFQSHLKDGNIARAWGNTVNLRITATYPIMIDLGYFSSQFTVSNIASWKNPDTTKVRHRGGELALSMPLLSKTRFFIPYIGAGYQISQLYTGPPVIQETGKDYSSIIEMAKNTSSPIYKFGLMINFNMMSYSVEYKHSFFNDKMPFYQLSANVGFKF